MHKNPVVIVGAAVLTAGAMFVAASAQPAPKAAAASVVVYKSATCGCCKIWVEHLRTHGFQVDAKDVSDSQLTSVAIQSGVPANLQTCHTAKVGRYIVEGHVPAEDVQRMLKEQPAIAGIAVGGMPMGSPGMEQGGQKQAFNTVAFTSDGKQTVFARH